MFKNLSSEALGISGRQSEIIEVALSFGFKGIDLNLAEFADTVRSHGMPHARRLLDSAKLKLGSFPLPVDWQHEDDTFKADMEKLPALAALAAEVGCLRAVTYVEPVSEFRPYHQNFEFHRQRLTEIAKKLEPLGIRLGIGFRAAGDLRSSEGGFEFVRALDPLLMLLGLLGAKNVGIVVDSWDLRASNSSLDSIRKLATEKIVTVNLADASADAAAKGWPAASRVLPGETGTIDDTELLTLLAERGYEGPITPAPHASRLAGMRRDASVKLAGETLDKVWKAAGLTPAGKLAPAPKPAPAAIAPPVGKPAAAQAPASKSVGSNSAGSATPPIKRSAVPTRR